MNPDELNPQQQVDQPTPTDPPAAPPPGASEPSFAYQYNTAAYGQLLGLFDWNNTKNWYDGKKRE